MNFYKSVITNIVSKSLSRHGFYVSGSDAVRKNSECIQNFTLNATSRGGLVTLSPRMTAGSVRVQGVLRRIADHKRAELVSTEDHRPVHVTKLMLEGRKTKGCPPEFVFVQAGMRGVKDAFSEKGQSVPNWWTDDCGKLHEWILQEIETVALPFYVDTGTTELVTKRLQESRAIRRATFAESIYIVIGVMVTSGKTEALSELETLEAELAHIDERMDCRVDRKRALLEEIRNTIES